MISFALLSTPAAICPLLKISGFSCKGKQGQDSFKWISTESQTHSNFNISNLNCLNATILTNIANFTFFSDKVNLAMIYYFPFQRTFTYGYLQPKMQWM